MRWLLVAALIIFPTLSLADPIRLAIYNVSMSRKGPGILLRDISSGKDDQTITIIQILQKVEPDILLILDFDNDAEMRTLKSFQERLAANEIHFPYLFAPMQNAGVPSGLDLNADGRLGGPADAFGYGLFRGQGQMALLSKFPINSTKAHDFSAFLWRDLAGADLPNHVDGKPFPSKDAQQAMRLSSKSHWVVPVETPDGTLNILASHHSPPVFDGPEDMNGKRNKDEARFWLKYLSDVAPANIVMMAGLNADPFDGDGAHEQVKQLLDHPRLQDPKPASDGGLAAANKLHRGDPSLDTADWRDDEPGNLRVDYILPDATMKVGDAGVFWPAPDHPDAEMIEDAGTSHRLVWVDVELP